MRLGLGVWEKCFAYKKPYKRKLGGKVVEPGI
jgi:hypothetical protein